MIKAKLAVFLAAATLSLSASAGFVQYNFSGATFSDGAPLTGYFVQNTDDKAIAYIDMYVGGDMHGAYFNASGHFSNISWANTYFAGAGPTNFAAYRDDTTMYYLLDLQFGATATAGTYRVFGNSDQWGTFPDSRTLVSGYAIQGIVNPNLFPSLEAGPVDGINHIVPQLVNAPARVPEPGSLALLMLGVAGLFGVRRQSKVAKSV